MHTAVFRCLLFLCFAFSSLHSLTAQAYKTAVGLRVDNGFNITLQQYIYDGWTAEGIIHTPLRTSDVGLSVLAEKHHKILFRGLNIYYGPGFHYYWKNENRRTEDVTSKNVYGLSLIGGAEIALGRLSLSVDLKPELHFTGSANTQAFEWNGAAISARYIIAKRERKKVKDWKIWDSFEREKD